MPWQLFFSKRLTKIARAVARLYTDAMPTVIFSRLLPCKFALLTTALAVLFLAACDTNKQSSDVSSAPRDSLVVTIAVMDSSTVLDATVGEHQVDFLSTSAGTFVKVIDSIPGADGYYWLYSVNGQMGKVAADRFRCGPGDTIRWHYRQTAR